MSMIAVITVASSISADAVNPSSVACTINVVNTVHAQDGQVISTETYQRNFVVSEGSPFSDDFSTATRFKFFDASMTRVNGASVVSIRWFADVSVFNSVDFGTSLKLANGQKSGDTSGDYTFSFSGGYNTTTYTLVGVRN
jgi:hypothetical protein